MNRKLMKVLILVTIPIWVVPAGVILLGRMAWEDISEWVDSF